MPARPLLEPHEVQRELNELDGWEGNTERVTKTFTFRNFVESVAFVNRIAEVAEELNHHPDIHIHWNKVTLNIWNWEAGGVTDACIRLARRADAVTNDARSRWAKLDKLS
jgi:4a-hydroxytetrahydrobiopterin dehydratase